MQNQNINEFLIFDKFSQDGYAIEIFKSHSYRVMYLAALLAKELGIYNEELRRAALLHDIGKVGISEKILLKPDKLNALEYTIIKAHSHIGNTIIQKHFKNDNIAVYVRDHHERWDGNGYPRGLSGANISTQGRIIGLCDAFDAMVVDRRVYGRKELLSTDEAINEMKNCAWTQFDGDLVERFIAIIREKGEQEVKEILEEEFYSGYLRNQYG